MHRLALLIVALLTLAACGTTRPTETRFAEPNQLMGEEIQNRISEIPFQHREELFHNLLWLVQSGEQAIPALLRSLNHPEAKVRSNSAWILAQIGDRRVIPDLQPLLRDASDTVKLEAARSLVMLGDVKNCPQLIDALDSDKVQVRYLCHEALKEATGQDFGYDHLSEDATSRRQKVLSWRNWWSELADDPWFAKSYADKHRLNTMGEAPAPAMETMLPTGSPDASGGMETETGSMGEHGHGESAPHGEAHTPIESREPQPEHGGSTPATGHEPQIPPAR